MKRILIIGLILIMGVITGTSLYAGSEKETAVNRYNKGIDYLNNKDYNQSIKMLEKAIEMGYTNEDVYYRLSICYYEIKEYMKSIANMDKAVEIVELKVADILKKKNSKVRIVKS